MNRRNLLTGATALAAGAILPAAASGAREADARLLASVARARALTEAYLTAEAENRRTFALMQDDPEMPHGAFCVFAEAERAKGSKLSDRALGRLERVRIERVYVRHGYRAAADAWNIAAEALRAAVIHVRRMRPVTIAGAAAKAALFAEVAERTDGTDGTDIVEDVLPALARDLRRLAKRGVT